MDQMTRDEKIKLLKMIAQKKAKEQERKLLDYNVKDPIHKIQVAFHKDPSYIRLFSGGNRCLAADTRVTLPGGTTIPICDVKKGDQILAYDPETGGTVAVPVVEVYDRGIRTCYQYSFMNYESVPIDLWCTPDHEILLNGSMVPADKLPKQSNLVRPAYLARTGASSRYALLLGLLTPNVEVSAGKLRLNLSAYILRQVKQILYTQKLDGFVQRDTLTYFKVFGKLGQLLHKTIQPYAGGAPADAFSYSTMSLKKFLSGIVMNAFTDYNKYSIILTFKSARLARQVSFFLKQVGVYTGAVFRSPKTRRHGFDINHLDSLQKLRPLLLAKDHIEAWKQVIGTAKACKKANDENIRSGPIIYSGKFGQQRQVQCYDLKLGEGHNLYLANGMVVGNSGKTTAGICEDLWWALGNHPYLEVPVPTKGLIICKDMSAANDYIFPKIKEWVPDISRIKIDRDQKSRPQKYTFTNGSTIRVMTHEQDDEAFEGKDWDWVHADEPPPRTKWIGSLRGLIDRGGRAWMTMTPLEEPWIYNELWLPSITGKREDISVYLADIRDNPWLTEEAIQRFESELTEDEKESRLRGKFKHLTGRVFKEFDTDKHVIDEIKRIPAYAPVYVGVDPHKRKKNAVLFLTITKDENIIIFDEIWEDITLPELCDAIKYVSKSRQVRPVSYLCDSSIMEPDPIYRIVPVSVFHEQGIPLRIAKKKGMRDAGIWEIRRLLKEDRLYVTKNCTQTIFNFLNYVYGENKHPENQGVCEEPRKIHDDMLDCLRYALQGNVTFSKPTTPVLYADPNRYRMKRNRS